MSLFFPFCTEGVQIAEFSSLQKGRIFPVFFFFIEGRSFPIFVPSLHRGSGRNLPVFSLVFKEEEDRRGNPHLSCVVFYKEGRAIFLPSHPPFLERGHMFARFLSITERGAISFLFSFLFSFLVKGRGRFACFSSFLEGISLFFTGARSLDR